MKKWVVPLLVLLALSAGLVFCWPALQILHARWIRLDESYAIGYPMVLMAVWWLFSRCGALLDRDAMPAYSALPLLFLVLVASAAGALVQLQVIPQLMMPAVLWLIVAALFGWRAALRMAPAFGLLYLAIPFVDIADPLRGMTVWFSQHMLNFFHIPVLIDGYNIRLAFGVIQVEGGCSGFNLLLAAVFVGLAQGEIAKQRLMQRLQLVVLAVVVGVIDNWIRVLSLVLIAHFTAMKSELIYHHGSFGWWIFAASMVPFQLIARRLELPAAPTARMQQYSISATRGRSLVSMTLAMLCIVAMIATLMTVGQHLERRVGSASAGFDVPTSVLTAPSWLPHYLGYDVAQAWQFTQESRTYERLVLTYVTQRADKKMIYYANVIATEQQLLRTGRTVIADGFNVNTAVVSENGRRMVWWFWWVDGRTAVSPLKTKLLQLVALLDGDPSSALMAVTVLCESADCSAEWREPAPIVKAMLLELRELKPIKTSPTVSR